MKGNIKNSRVIAVRLMYRVKYGDQDVFCHWKRKQQESEHNDFMMLQQLLILTARFRNSIRSYE